MLVKICGEIVLSSSFELALMGLSFRVKMELKSCLGLGNFETRVANLGV